MEIVCVNLHWHVGVFGVAGMIMWKNATYSMDFMLRSALSLWNNWKGVNEQEALLNTDVAMESNSGTMGMGWIIRDEMGVLMAAKSSTYSGYFDVKEAETVSIREALSWVKALGYGDIDVETDSQIVFYALSSTSYNSPFSLIIDDVKEGASPIRDLVFRFARRSANRAAHALAREAACFFVRLRGVVPHSPSVSCQHSWF
ncbi:PREDICTED: uncharacterized protein LOC109176680 [Ipomoea nil]|uniref:uncharacterized protein LOC109176680 n=1 Tax=Ipomoea nil TaxID=35883 RepID=UPI000901369D|nr:PREDICTED: uncharacterized protein LOC109176680 [Ipomoea nil]